MVRWLIALFFAASLPGAVHAQTPAAQKPAAPKPPPAPIRPQCGGRPHLYARRREALLRGLRRGRAAAARARQRRQHRRPRSADRALPQALQGDRDGQPRSGQVRRQPRHDHLREDDRRSGGAARSSESRAGQRAGLERRRHRGAAARDPPPGEGEEDRGDGRQPEPDRSTPAARGHRRWSRQCWTRYRRRGDAAGPARTEGDRHDARRSRTSTPRRSKRSPRRRWCWPAITM